MCISKNKEMETIDEMRKREREGGGGGTPIINSSKQTKNHCHLPDSEIKNTAEICMFDLPVYGGIVTWTFHIYHTGS